MKERAAWHAHLGQKTSVQCLDGCLFWFTKRRVEGDNVGLEHGVWNCDDEPPTKEDAIGLCRYPHTWASRSHD